MSQRTIIVGAGHAGGQCAISLRQAKYEGEIVLIGDEPHYPYERPPLSKQMLIDGISVEKLSLRKPGYYEKQRIECRLNEQVVEIHRDTQELSLNTGEKLHYDHLVLATGGEVRKLSLPGSELPGIHYIRKIGDTQDILEDIKPDMKIVVIGGGYIGLEAAASMRKQGYKVTLLEAADYLLGRSVDEEVADFYLDYHLTKGVDIHLGAKVVGFEGTARVAKVVCEDGSSYEADLVIVGIGIIPNTSLAETSGLKVNNGIWVNEYCQTSDERIFAIGDVAVHISAIYRESIRLESVPNAVGQARVAAKYIAGNPISYTELPWFWSDQYDLKLQMAGLNIGYDQKIIRGAIDQAAFAVWYLKGNQIQAVHAINKPRDFMFGKQFIAKRVKIDVAKLIEEQALLKEIVTQ